MNKKQDKKNLLMAPLRAEAEARLVEMLQNRAQATLDEPATTNLLHELRLHQIELEMQNAALRCAQIELEASRDRYLDLYEFAPVGYLTLNRDALIIKANLTMVTLLGVERNKLLQQRFAAFIAPADRDRWHRFFTRALRRNEKHSGEFMLNSADGSRIHARLDCLRRTVASSPALRMICTDVTAQRLSETVLRLQSAALEAAAEAIFITDCHGVIVWSNSAFSILTGYRTDEVIGRRPQDLVKSGQHGPALYRDLWETILSGQVWRGELINRRKDGTLYHEYQTITPIRDAAGLVSHFIAIKKDVTERKKMEQERADYLDRLEKKARRLVAIQEDARRLVSRELHDRTSSNLAAMAINLNIIATGLSKQLLPELWGRLEDTRVLLADTESSIRDVCAELRPAVLDYAGLLAAMESYAHQFARRTGIAVNIDGGQHDVRLASDLESVLFRIFQEALTNCAKHSQAKSIMIELHNAGYPVVLIVADDGAGFNPALLAQHPASGLGVLNMREMALYAGGRLTIESQPGCGTRITVEI
ncbi:MAG: PAS domain S-box protein [Methylococcaceae bacterium]|nr:MAG: PAS domain S-box protein [Methylococcaceae bacterium]